MDTAPIELYLRYHWAGAGGGKSLARTLADRHREGTHGAALDDVARQVEEDDATLQEILEHVGARQSRLARGVAMVSERVARWKPEGRRDGDSSLGPVLDAEFMISGVTGKRALWVALGESDDVRLDRWDFDDLRRRADGQLASLREFHLDAARRALTTGSTAAQA